MGIRIFTNLMVRRYDVMYAYTYVGARLSYTSNEVLQNVYCCVFNPKCHYMQWLTLFSATRPFLSVPHLA